VDHLLERRAARVVGVDLFEEGAATATATECGLVERLLEGGATVAVPRFGASDCRRCPSHLLRVEREHRFTVEQGVR
jgi:Uri superfamily endonuclease